MRFFCCCCCSSPFLNISVKLGTILLFIFFSDFLVKLQGAFVAVVCLFLFSISFSFLIIFPSFFHGSVLVVFFLETLTPSLQSLTRNEKRFSSDQGIFIFFSSPFNPQYVHSLVFICMHENGKNIVQTLVQASQPDSLAF